MKRTKIPNFSAPISKEVFDNMFEELNDNFCNSAQSKLQKGQLRKWRKLKHQLI